MDALQLDPGEYSGTYKLAGGRVCLDLINTIAWPGRENEHDWFDQWTNVIDWSVATALLHETDAHALRRRYSSAPDAVADAIEVIKHRRRILRDAVSPLVGGGKPSARSMREVNCLLATTLPLRRIDPDTLEWTWAPPTNLEDITAPIILDAADLLTAADHTRLGRCPCAWLFYDKSRNRSRRWCDMADCGSRDKSLRYYHRQRGIQES